MRPEPTPKGGGEGQRLGARPPVRPGAREHRKRVAGDPAAAGTAAKGGEGRTGGAAKPTNSTKHFFVELCTANSTKMDVLLTLVTTRVSTTEGVRGEPPQGGEPPNGRRSRKGERSEPLGGRGPQPPGTPPKAGGGAAEPPRRAKRASLAVGSVEHQGVYYDTPPRVTCDV